jgi:hypothetical protein
MLLNHKAIIASKTDSRHEKPRIAGDMMKAKPDKTQARLIKQQSGRAD